MYKTTIFLIFFFFSSLGLAKPLTLEEISEASVKVSVNRAAGSGVVVYKNEDHYYILTNAHVVEGANSGHVEFFNAGYKTGKIPMRVIWRRFNRNTNVDYAFLTVKKEDIDGYTPRVIPMSASTLQGNEYIMSAGCPGGRWLQSFEGRLTGLESDRLLFLPPPESGRSGSGIIATINDKSYVCGLVTWHIGRNGWDSNGNPIGKGGGVSMKTLRSIMTGETKHEKQIPSNYKYLKQSFCLFALGSDGNYYHQRKNKRGVSEVKVPPGTKIVKWNIRIPDS